MKSVLVTGGTVRLGEAIAEHLRSLGWRTLTTSSRPDSGADIIGDFREPSGAAEVYAAALRLLGGVPPDALVNNASLFTGSDADIEAVGLTAPKKLTILMAGRETAGRGAVVNILDAEEPGGDSGTVRNAEYREVKRALREYTRLSAAMFIDTLRVNSVSPGPIAGLAPVGVREKAGVCPLGRPEAREVAKAVAYLLEAEAVTGQDIAVDGGLTGLISG